MSVELLNQALASAKLEQKSKIWSILSANAAAICGGASAREIKDISDQLDPLTGDCGLEIISLMLLKAQEGSLRASLIAKVEAGLTLLSLKA